MKENNFSLKKLNFLDFAVQKDSLLKIFSPEKNFNLRCRNGAIACCSLLKFASENEFLYENGNTKVEC